MSRGTANLSSQIVAGICRRLPKRSTASLGSSGVRTDPCSNRNTTTTNRCLSSAQSLACLPRVSAVFSRSPSKPFTPREMSQRCWKSQGTVSASNHATSRDAFTDKDDPYDKYRHSQRRPYDDDSSQPRRRLLSPHILAELQLETVHTQRRINLKVLEQTQDLVYQAWKQQSKWVPPESGPTGTWAYQFADDMAASGRRIYQRYSKDDDQSKSQIVLELEPVEEVLSLSLTVDESCIACLVENVSTGQRQVRLRHIESDRQSALELIGDGGLYGSLVSLEWGPMICSEGADVHSLYFVGTDEQGRPDRVLVSTVHSTVLHVDDPQLLIQSHDPAEILDVQRTKGCQYVSIHVMAKTSNEIYLSQGPSSLELVLPKDENVQYHLDVGEQKDIVLLVSHQGMDYQLFESSVSSLPMDPESIKASSRNRANQEPKVVVTDMDLFRNYLVFYETSTETGVHQITLHNRDSQDASHSQTIPLSIGDSASCIQVAPAGNVCFDANSLNLLLETPVTPPSTYELDFTSNELRHLRGVDLTMVNYQQERVMVSSRDGTQVPMSLIYRENQIKNNDPSWWNWFGSSEDDKSISPEHKPIVLIGYGSYGKSVNMGFDPALVPLLERGYVLAFAHTRGGGELGRTWYHAGRQHNKPKVIEDFIACAEYLRNRWKGSLTAKGFSAAGVMMGAAVNQRPELFDNLILTNPFLDVFATMCNPNLYLTAHEWNEFGNPLQDPTIDQIIRSYCPVRNVAANTDNYPRCLLIGTLDDENVPFWNPAIFAKKIRDRMTRTAKDKVFLHMEEEGGHHLGQQRLQVAAMELAFILRDNEHEQEIV